MGQKHQGNDEIRWPTGRWDCWRHQLLRALLSDRFVLFRLCLKYFSTFIPKDSSATSVYLKNVSKKIHKALLCSLKISSRVSESFFNTACALMWNLLLWHAQLVIQWECLISHLMGGDFYNVFYTFLCFWGLQQWDPCYDSWFSFSPNGRFACSRLCVPASPSTFPNTALLNQYSVKLWGFFRHC